MADTLDLLEDRISDLERKVFGHTNPSSEEIRQTPVTVSLIQTGRTLGSAIAGHDKTSTLLNRLKELNNLVEMACEDSSTAAKLEIILVKEAELRSNLAQLEQACRLASSVLDNNTQEMESLKAVNNFSDKLDSLTIRWMDTWQDCDAVDDEVRELFDRYNTIVNDLKRSFILFDELVSAKEASASAAKVLD